MWPASLQSLQASDFWAHNQATGVDRLQWSLYFKTTHGTKKMWSYIAGGLKIKVI